MRRVAYLALLAGVAASLGGCQSISDAAGLSKDPPDEFAVATKAPLIIPPDYNLKPPSPGAPPLNQIGPSDAAEDALYSSQPAAGIQGQLSAGEQDLLSKAGAADADGMVRQKIAADNRTMQAADQSFTNQILFGMGSSGTSAGTNVDASSEAKRLNQANPDAEKPAQQPADNSSSNDSDSGGWFDWLP
jgi:hypothetical protein